MWEKVVYYDPDYPSDGGEVTSSELRHLVRNPKIALLLKKEYGLRYVKKAMRADAEVGIRKAKLEIVESFGSVQEFEEALTASYKLGMNPLPAMREAYPYIQWAMVYTGANWHYSSPDDTVIVWMDSCRKRVKVQFYRGEGALLRCERRYEDLQHNACKIRAKNQPKKRRVVRLKSEKGNCE